MGGGTRHPIRVDPALRPLFAALGAGAGSDVVVLEESALVVRLGWLFRARVERDSVLSVRRHADVFGGWGAHGWRGRWLVNGSSKGIVEIDLAPGTDAVLLGFWPLRLRQLLVSLEDPQALIAELGQV